MSKFSMFRIGVLLSIILTILPFPGLLKQLTKPTGDKIVISIVGIIVTAFFLISLYLVYISLSNERLIQQRTICRLLSWLLLIYPLLGFVPSLLIIRATTNSDGSQRIQIHDLEVTGDEESISKNELLLLAFFLKFFPNREGLLCRIRTWRDDVFVSIHCQT